MIWDSIDVKIESVCLPFGIYIHLTLRISILIFRLLFLLFLLFLFLVVT
jgi:hypothetical protein